MRFFINFFFLRNALKYCIESANKFYVTFSWWWRWRWWNNGERRSWWRGYRAHWHRRGVTHGVIWLTWERMTLIISRGRTERRVLGCLCLPSPCGDVVDDGVLVEVGDTVLLLERVVEVDWPGKGMTLIETKGVIAKRVLVCLLSPVHLPTSPDPQPILVK